MSKPDFHALAQPGIKGLKAYDPGLDLVSLRRQSQAAGKFLVELGSNENSLGPSPRAREALLDCLHELHRYPDPLGGDLKLVVMSATLNAGPIAAYLDGCPVLRSEGKRFDVAIEHLPRSDERPLHEQVAGAVRRLVGEGLDGDVLVFLPGAAEIRRAQTACAELADKQNLLVLPLHGDLTAAEQDRAVKPAAQRIALTTGDGMIFVPTQDIIYCQAESNYTSVVLTGGRKILVSKVLKDIDEALSGPDFFRVHNSWLINLNQIAKFVRGDGGYVVMQDGATVSISRSRRQEFMELFEKF